MQIVGLQLHHYANCRLAAPSSVRLFYFLLSLKLVKIMEKEVVIDNCCKKMLDQEFQ